MWRYEFIPFKQIAEIVRDNYKKQNNMNIWKKEPKHEI